MTVEKFRQLKAGQPQVVSSVGELYALVKIAEAWNYIKWWAEDEGIEEGIELGAVTFNEAVESLASEVGIEWVETADFYGWLRREGNHILRNRNQSTLR
jgi:hypothetical protein